MRDRGMLCVIVGTAWLGVYGCGPSTDGSAARPPDGGRWADTMRMGPEISIEMSEYGPHTGPTGEQLMAAAEFVRATTVEAERFRDYEWARGEGGFELSNAEILDRLAAEEWHVFNPDNIRDDRVLDPRYPESLMYRFSDDAPPQLIGVMYLMPLGRPGPQIGGPLTRWHYHPTVEFCFDSAGVPTRKAPLGNDPGGGCPVGETNGPMAEMLHVWLVPNANGVFSHLMVAPDDPSGGHAH